VSWQVNSPAWNCATANTPACRTASARPRPPACATYPVTAPTQRRLARNHPRSYRSRRLVETDRLHHQSRTDHLRDRRLPLPRPARRRPQRPPNPVTHRRHLVLGQRHQPNLATTPRRVPLTENSPSTDPKNHHRQWKRPPTERHLPNSHAQPHKIRPHHRPTSAPTEPTKPHEKRRLNEVFRQLVFGANPQGGQQGRQVAVLGDRWRSGRVIPSV
jgi:hypothetical protein